ncbi:MAG TPA: 23S rRNA (uracil(1939)-C(5))-methyltransferase RlmD [Candidatus Accumulibacter phosphatis]|nr:MAG: 23S rRNA (uracil(1939)-C(5))-methyltransferase RlmD [Candidatus Accumulibacter sp. SK-11]HAY26806.1 23S rRNA (uracil(1939)-C(5))-methyltransferase RlmD [Accumulibacter sp.]HRL74307.1 23S rRNA (uracil(1939)-C(5))-methyltransferase RlmD [Candidatus Accumulibacter phosphatis]HCN69902.1 23S rRNA (uracil(1939)-C(5))-methyltransferase RlmD [Accumulibacter sp.]HCV13297.1 23S rRNA (uracil(1939)-C(5))-methyltransferase RlmD [Accumulibacter sp.]
MPTGIIESLDHEARGVTRLEGKTVFVEGALPGELVEYASYRRKPGYELARVVQVLHASANRVPPRCPHFGVCGGCSMQHFDPAAQVAAKQRLLEDNLWHIGRLKAEELYAPIHGESWGYRYRARLSVRFVAKKGGVLVGFHERRSSYVADMRQCEILPPRLSALLLPLRELVGSLSIRERLPQIEVAVGERITALVLRVLDPPTPADEVRLREFADLWRVVFYLQPQGPATAHRFHPLVGEPLSYVLPDFAVEHPFSPTEFTQVNHAINRALVRRALALLAPRPGERIADLFCGLGNFSLPIARSGAHVVGVEGSQELVRRATENAAVNGLAGLAEYRVANLFETTPESLAALGRFDRMLIDPPREGAVELVKALAADAPQRIVYVSCSPATLARDAAILVTQKAYRLRGAGVVNMFPHTSHVESIALFERNRAARALA